MRPRINSFGKITRIELDEYLYSNKVYGFTAERKNTTICYTYFIMFRKNKEDPEKLFIEVSRMSKLVLKAWTNKGNIFNNVEELKNYTKYKL